MEVLDPSPFDGGWRCTASPAQNTRPDRYDVAYILLLPHNEIERMVTGMVSSPTS